jgi:aminopeptidase N
MRRTLSLALGTLVFFASPAAAGTPLDATTRDYDQTHLIVRVEPFIEESRVEGETTVRFESLVDPLRVLRLHCQETAVLHVKDREGEPQEFALADNVLAITLGKPVPRGAEGEVTVRYRSRPTAGLYFHSPTKSCPDTPLQMYSQGEGTDNRRWIPCYDEPDDRCTAEVIVTLPKRLQSISGGTLTGRKDLPDGRAVDSWKLDHRIPSYLVSLIVGTFETVTAQSCGIPLEFHGPPGRAAEVVEGCSATAPALEFFTAYTGRAYPYPRYATTTVWDFVYGGMENASATTMNMRLLHPPEARPNYSADGLVAHELAHQWFGDLLTCRTWDHLWLNEGFATYFTDLFFEHRDGPEEFSLHRFRQNRGYMDGTPKADTLGLKPDPRGDVPLELFGGKQYDRGAAILHQLRIELGDELFRRGVARYVKDHEDKAVVSDDLRRSFESERGTSLEWFFDQWVYGAGYPVFDASWAEAVQEGADRKPVIRVTLEQVQTAGGGQPEAFRISVPYRFHTDKEIFYGRFDVRRRRQQFDIATPEDWRGVRPGDFLRLGDGGGTFARIRLKQPPASWLAALAKDSDPTGRIEATEALPEWPDQSGPALVAALGGDKFHAVRAAAAKALGEIDTKTASDALATATLKDQDPRVREAAVEALGRFRRESAAAIALGALERDKSPYVRAAAARALGRLHAEGAFETLRDLFSVDSHREVVRQGALDGLASLGDRRALELARTVLPYNFCRGDHHGMRRSALDLLLALAPDEPETHAAVRQMLDDPYFRMRSWAATAAGTYRVRSAEERLRRMAQSDPDNGAKAAARTALERLAGK